MTTGAGEAVGGIAADAVVTDNDDDNDADADANGVTGEVVPTAAVEVLAAVLEAGEAGAVFVVVVAVVLLLLVAAAATAAAAAAVGDSFVDEAPVAAAAAVAAASLAALARPLSRATLASSISFSAPATCI